MKYSPQARSVSFLSSIGVWYMEDVLNSRFWQRPLTLACYARRLATSFRIACLPITTRL